MTSFDGVTLEVGGDVETYWKSMAMPISSIPAPVWPKHTSYTGSAQTSPSAHSVASSAGHAFTISSLHGNYVYVVVQVTRDFHPVVYPDWLLPDTGFDLGVADVTLAQFEALAKRFGRSLSMTNASMALDWPALISHSMVSLAQLMKVGIDLSISFRLH